MAAEPSSQDGKPCQRLTIRFDRAGLKTISTAFAELRPASDAPAVAAAPAVATNGEPNPFAAGSRAEVEESMLRLPDDATDAFVPLGKRVRTTLALYRFGDTPGGLLDWASAQTGLKDPMVRFNRHELEQWFSRFRVALDAHLRKLLKDVRRQEPALLAQLQSEASASAKQAMRRADMDR